MVVVLFEPPTTPAVTVEDYFAQLVAQYNIPTEQQAVVLHYCRLVIDLRTQESRLQLANIRNLALAVLSMFPPKR